MIPILLSYPWALRVVERWNGETLGSVKPLFHRTTVPPYQLAFRTPGIIPDSDSSLKQIRQRPNRRRNARDRPHRPHRLCFRTANFGFRFDFSIMAFLAIVFPN